MGDLMAFSPTRTEMFVGFDENFMGFHGIEPSKISFGLGRIY